MLASAGVEPLGTYESIAEELNYKPAQLLQEQLFRFLKENDIQIYDFDAVDRYLAAIAEKEGKVWIWRPLRQQDTPNWGAGECGRNNHIGWWGRAPTGHTGQVFAGHGSCRPKDWVYRAYDRAVPAHVLRHVKKIEGKFGERVKFLVSDYAVPKPDPFIAVTAPDVDLIIFDAWDEPGFGEPKSL